MPKFDIVVENSAPSQHRPAKSVEWATRFLAPHGLTSVADLGCGRLRNLGLLRSHYTDVTLVETELQCCRIRELVPNDESIRLMTVEAFAKAKRQYEAIFLISVLHIIPNPRGRKSLVALAEAKLRRKGYLVIDVPRGEHYYKARCTPETRYLDGHLMGRGRTRTFYKDYCPAQLDRLVSAYTSLQLVEKVRMDGHIVRLWRKPG